MSGRVTRRRDGDDGTVRGEARALRERAERFWKKIERHRVEPGRPAVRQIATRAPRPSSRCFELWPGNEGLAPREVRKSPVVIHVQMREHDPLHIARTYTQRSQLRADLLLAL